MATIKDAIVLVTGANGGLGTKFVEIALERGAAKVYAAARAPKQWDDARVVPLALDLTDPASIQKAATDAADTTILVNNAAIFPHTPLLAVSPEELDAVIETNLTGPIRLTQALAPALKSAKGALVNVNSVLSWFAVGSAHSVSKAGLWMATNAFRLELAPEGVHVLGVYPGRTDTPMQAGYEGPKNDPADVVNGTYDAVEASEFEYISDPEAEQVHGALTAPITALYPMLAGK